MRFSIYIVVFTFLWKLQVDVKWNVFIFSLFIWIFFLLLFHAFLFFSLASRHNSSHRRFSIENVVFWKFHNIHRRIHVSGQFLIKLQPSRPTTLLKKDTSADVLLWILWNFKEQQLRTAATANSVNVSFIVSLFYV